MTELKKCPFCGSQAITEVIIGDEGHALTCSHCHATGMVMTSSAKFEDVEKAWNTRPIESALEAEVARLNDRNDKLEDCFREIENWCKAYALDIAPEPSKEDMKRADKILAKNGISFSQINISAMRRVINGVMDIAIGALKGE